VIPESQESQLAPPKRAGGTGRVIRLSLTVIPTLLVSLSFLYLLFEPVEPAEPLPQVNEKDVVRIERKLRSLRPTGYYIVIDTASNRLWLKRGDQVLLDARCSTGSGRKLECQGRTWAFETPRGEFRIGGKISHPVWRKPDWAFYEEGRSLPTDERDRYEKNVLGEYAMALGDGYFIHGTLYTRMLGRNVTHGCVRLGSKDLVRLARTVPVGTKVYIF
jgi:hypothetical protein